jgi:hypothetical protein
VRKSIKVIPAGMAQQRGQTLPRFAFSPAGVTVQLTAWQVIDWPRSETHNQGRLSFRAAG